MSAHGCASSPNTRSGGTCFVKEAGRGINARVVTCSSAVICQNSLTRKVCLKVFVEIQLTCFVHPHESRWASPFPAHASSGQSATTVPACSNKFADRLTLWTAAWRCNAACDAHAYALCMPCSLFVGHCLTLLDNESVKSSKVMMSHGVMANPKLWCDPASAYT